MVVAVEGQRQGVVRVAERPDERVLVGEVRDGRLEGDVRVASGEGDPSGGNGALVSVQLQRGDSVGKQESPETVRLLATVSSIEQQR